MPLSAPATSTQLTTQLVTTVSASSPSPKQLWLVHIQGSGKDGHVRRYSLVVARGMQVGGVVGLTDEMNRQPNMLKTIDNREGRSSNEL